MKETIKKWIGSTPKKCDICGQPITCEFTDGKTRSTSAFGGVWGIMCDKCHHNWGVGLGLGKGQKYQKQNDEFVKVGG